jgi:competence protein ComEA
MKETLGKPVPLWWFFLMVGVTATAGVLASLLLANAPPQNAVLIVPADEGTPIVSGRASTSIVTGTAALPFTPTPAPIAVYVSGAVAKPGVYTLQPGARVADAVAAAGGLRPDADPEAINLAARVSDEEHIAVPELIPTPLPGTVVSQVTAVRTQSTPAPRKSPTPGKININTAGPEELESLPDIGPALASRIIEHRASNGPFKSIEDLADVPGIGDATLERLRSLVTVGR